MKLNTVNAVERYNNYCKVFVYLMLLCTLKAFLGSNLANNKVWQASSGEPVLHKISVTGTVG